MKQRIQGIIIGLLVSALLFGGVVTVTGASVTWKKIEVGFDNYKVVIDGKEFTAKDGKGNVIESFSYNGWIYSPFEHIAKALGKPVYWDGNAKTLYIGSMNGKLKYPTLRLEDALNISGKEFVKFTNPIYMIDNYGNRYTSVMRGNGSWTNETAIFQTLLNYKYSAFKGTFYVMQGANGENKASFYIEADGKVIYSSPELSKTSSPVNFNVDITGCNDFKIYTTSTISLGVFFGDTGFYQ